METSASQQFIRKIGALSDDGVAVFDQETDRFSYFNERFLRIFGLTRQQLQKDYQLLLKVINAEDVDYLSSRYKELSEKGHVNTTEFRLNFPGNQVRHVSVDLFLLDDPGQLACFVKDMSDAKRHEEYLIKCTAQKDTLLDMLVHNLSGPLHLSRDMITMLHQGLDTKNSTDVEKFISLIRENTQQCIEIVNDFLREEHLESMHTYVRKTRFDIIEKINVILQKLKEMNTDKVFSFKPETNCMLINSDAVKFFQVVHNILSNAVKFTDVGGKIDISLEDQDKHYVIGVHDNGIGIPPHLRPAIFIEKVAGLTGLKGEKSNGMGLSITKKLLDLMKGEIWYESVEGSGSAFFIRLPKE